MQITTDFLILGSGIAGLSFALRAQEHGQVVVVTKRAADEAATSWAQGGISAVLSPEDSFEKHVDDTMVAGAGLCHQVVADICAREAPEAIRWLSETGARFSRADDGQYELGREGVTASDASCTPATSRGARSSAPCSTPCALRPTSRCSSGTWASI
jgi:L-aspartate oxidase